MWSLLIRLCSVLGLCHDGVTSDAFLLMSIFCRMSHSKNDIMWFDMKKGKKSVNNLFHVKKSVNNLWIASMLMWWTMPCKYYTLVWGVYKSISWLKAMMTWNFISEIPLQVRKIVNGCLFLCVYLDFMPECWAVCIFFQIYRETIVLFSGWLKPLAVLIG